jgi:voltage-gated potassium channel
MTGRKFVPRLRQARRLYSGLHRAMKEPAVRTAVSLVAALILIASVFYWIVEGWSLLDSIYFSVVTLATVGYGDFVPKTALGKIFTIAYIFCGLGIFISAATALAQAIAHDETNRPV